MSGNFSRRQVLQSTAAGLALSQLPAVASASIEDVPLEVDFGDIRGSIKPLHGVNGGPFCDGETIDLTKPWQEAGIPFARLHDCNWPRPDVVDFHAIFPNETADPTKPESYRFGKTDDYIAGVLKSGAQIVFRLGESIEHSKTKFHAHPPQDYAQWTAACCGIIRHYNAGWANGFQHNIKYWEIWNEPENKPAMWSGTDEQYYELYTMASKGIKREFPDVKVGGPAIGAVGEVKDGQFTRNSYLDKFIAYVRQENAPLDFFSWHTYSDDPTIYGKKAKAIRAWLDEQSFAKTEQHLNEWNYLPENSWGPLANENQGVKREAYYAEMASINGGAFLAYVLCDLQESSIDVANLFSGDNGPFGLFTQHGVPKKTYYALRAFQVLRETPRKATVRGNSVGSLITAAGLSEDNRSATLLIANFRAKSRLFTVTLKGLPPGNWRGTSYLLDYDKNLVARKVDLEKEQTSFGLNSAGSSVIAVRLVAE